MQKKGGDRLLIFVMIGLLALFLFKGTYSGQVIRSEITMNNEDNEDVAFADGSSQQNLIIRSVPDAYIAPEPPIR